MSDSDTDSPSCSERSSYDSEESTGSTSVEEVPRRKGKSSTQKREKARKKAKRKSRDRETRRKSHDRNPRRKRKRVRSSSADSSSEEEASSAMSEDDSGTANPSNEANVASLAALDELAAAAPASLPSGRMQETLRDFDNLGKVEPNVSDNINDSLASLLNPTLRLHPDDAEVDKLVAKYLRPRNLENLTPPELNKDIKQALSKGAGKTEERLLRVQDIVGAQLACTLRILDDIGHKVTESRPIVDYAQQIRDAVRFNIWAFASLHQSRKDNIWNSMGYPTSLVCTWDEPVGTSTLFDGDVMKRIETRKREAAKARQLKRET